MEVIRWEAPNPQVPRGVRANRYQPVADSLRLKPNEWALVEEEANRGTLSGIQAYVKAGKGPFAPAGSFDARIKTAGMPANVGSLYIIYLGMPGNE